MPRLLVLGNACWDVGLRLPRLPLAGETLVGVRGPSGPGGKGLNQAVVAARAGAEVRLVVALGDDQDGAAVRAALAREPLGFAPLASRHPTDLSVLAVAPDGENLVLSTNACADAIGAGEAAAACATLRAGDALLLQGGLTEEATAAAAAAARAHGARVWLNAAPVRWPLGPLLALLDLLVLNATEAAQAAGQAMGQATGQATGQAAGQATGQATPADAARALRSAVPSGTAVVVTLGGAGLIGPDGVCLPAPPLPAPPRDTTGAGDAFCGALAAALLRGHADPLGAAQAAAAISVGRDGCFASLPTSSELARVLGPG